MTPETRRTLGIVLALYAAAILQCRFADTISVFGARPDFPTATVILGAIFCDASGGASVGFFAGLLYASVVSPPHAGFGSLIVSRTLIGTGVGWLESRLFRDNGLIAIGLVAVGTALANALFFLLAPQPNIAHWLRAALSTVLYNTVIAFPLYLIIRWLVGKYREEDLR